MGVIARIPQILSLERAPRRLRPSLPLHLLLPSPDTGKLSILSSVDLQFFFFLRYD